MYIYIWVCVCRVNRGREKPLSPLFACLTTSPPLSPASMSTSTNPPSTSSSRVYPRLERWVGAFSTY